MIEHCAYLFLRQLCMYDDMLECGYADMVDGKRMPHPLVVMWALAAGYLDYDGVST